MKRIYVAGPMSGIKDLNFPAFHAETARLRSLGYEVVNPAEINTDTVLDFNDKLMFASHWVRCMRKDIAQLVTCDAVALLPGWETSKGATIEQRLASDLHMFVVVADQIEVGPDA